MAGNVDIGAVNVFVSAAGGAADTVLPPAGPGAASLLPSFGGAKSACSCEEVVESGMDFSGGLTSEANKPGAAEVTGIGAAGVWVEVIVGKKPNGVEAGVANGALFAGGAEPAAAVKEKLDLTPGLNIPAGGGVLNSMGAVVPVVDAGSPGFEELTKELTPCALTCCVDGAALDASST